MHNSEAFLVRVSQVCTRSNYCDSSERVYCLMVGAVVIRVPIVVKES